MSEPTPSNAASASTSTARGDVGRRIALRREELGLTREEAAVRAGTAPGYLQYLEEQASAMPGSSILIRLADALETTVTALRGGDADLPPGLGLAASHPVLVELSDQECRTLMGKHGVGRLAVDTPDGPGILPINYTVIDGAVTFRTAPGTAPAKAAGTQVAFEVDRIDDALSRGWSVLVRGRAAEVTDPEAVRHLAEHEYSGPWAGGPRETWVRIEAARMTGRRIVVR